MSAAFYSSDLAYVHHAGFGSFSKSAAPGLLKRIRAADLESGILVDLGCGSGIWLREAARAGYKTVGVDFSPAMLRLAKMNSPTSKLLRGSFHNARIPRCSIVTAIGEPLCYLPPGESGQQSLGRLFRRVADALEPGGLFIFDLLTRKPGHFINSRSWRAGEDWAVLFAVTEDKRKASVSRDITVFRKWRTGYRRSREVHRARVYGVAEVRANLLRAGFSVQISDSYGKFRLPPRRTAFFATKAFF